MCVELGGESFGSCYAWSGDDLPKQNVQWLYIFLEWLIFTKKTPREIVGVFCLLKIIQLTFSVSINQRSRFGPVLLI